MDKISFEKDEKKIIGQISFIFAVRQAAFSLIMPFLSIYIHSMEDYSKALAGLAFSMFHLSQALFQIPMGKLSDRYGRKGVAIMALLFYWIGTVLAGFSINIYHLIFARFLTGIGSAKSVFMSWLADGIAKEKRNSAFTYVGIAIGVVAIIGFYTSSIIAGKIGTRYLFYICATLILVLIMFLILKSNSYEYNYLNEFKIEFKKENTLTTLKNMDLMRLNVMGFIAHFCLTCTFFIMPILIAKTMGIDITEITNTRELVKMTKINGPLGIVGTALMFYFGRRADRNGALGSIKIAVLCGITGALFAILFNDLYLLAIAFILLYSAHCIFQPILPATVSKYPNTNVRGTAMGILITFQAIGAATGGFIGGIMLDDYKYCFALLIVLFIAGLILLSGFKEFREG